MGLLKRFRLEKLQVQAFQDTARSVPAGTFAAMFNPESIRRSYETEFSGYQGLDTMWGFARFAHSRSPSLSVKLVIDGTGVNEIGLTKLFSSPKVSARVQEFLKLCHEMNGEIHEPNYLVLKWGDLRFSCRLGNVDVTYTRFDRDGTPLRAELDATFVGDEDPKKRNALENKSSPDLTHIRVVNAGDTLPLLAKEIYGSSSLYLFVAEANGLDDFRRLRPGTQLVFPPLPAARESD